MKRLLIVSRRRTVCGKPVRLLENSDAHSHLLVRILPALAALLTFLCFIGAILWEAACSTSRSGQPPCNRCFRNARTLSLSLFYLVCTEKDSRFHSKKSGSPWISPMLYAHFLCSWDIPPHCYCCCCYCYSSIRQWMAPSQWKNENRK